MYAPPYHRVSDDAGLLPRLQEVGFVTVVAAGADGPVVAHAPVVVDAGGTPTTLAFHLARPNPAVAALKAAGAALVTAIGPHHYVSPDWYETADMVPTWNYVAVHAAGPIRPLDADETRAHLDALSAEYERRLAPKPVWTTAKMTPRKLETMLRGIVAFELRIEALEGTDKLSQNRNEADRRGVVSALETLGTGAAGDVARLMRAADQSSTPSRP